MHRKLLEHHHEAAAPRPQLIIRRSFADGADEAAHGSGSILLEIRLVEAAAPPARAAAPASEDRLLLRVDEAAKLLAISRAALYQMLGTDLPVVRLGRAVRVPREAIEELIRERTDELR